MLLTASRLHNLYRAHDNGLIRLAILIGAATGLIGCQPAPRPTPQILTATPLPYTATPAPTALPVHISISLDTPGRAAIRVVNALTASSSASEVVPVDVYLDGSPLVTRLAADLPSTALGFQAGHFQLRVFTSSDQGLKLSQPIDLVTSQSVIVVLTGTPDKITATLLVNNTDAIPAGQIRLSLAHFQNNAPVSISMVAVDGQANRLATIDTPGIIVSAPPQPLTVQSFTFSQSGHDTKPFALGTVTERQAYLAIWLPSGTVAIIQDDTPRTAQLRVIDANPALAAIDLRLSAAGTTGHYQPLSSALKFGESRPWQPVAVGHYAVGLFDVGAAADSRPKFTVEIDLLADTNQNVILYGTADQPQISAIIEDLSPLSADSATKARLTVVNAAPGARGLFTLLSGGVVNGLPPVEYGQASGPTVLPVGDVSLAFQAQSNNPGTPQSVEFKTPFTLRPNTAYLYVVTGTVTTVPAALFTTTLPALSANVTPNPSDSLATGTATSPMLRVRLINALGDDTAIDLTLNGKKLFQAVKTGSGTNYQSYAPQAGRWSINVAGQTNTLAVRDLAQIDHGSITLILIGSITSAQLEQSVDYLPAGASPSAALVDVIHAAPGAGAIRVERPLLLPTTIPPATLDVPTTIAPAAITATPISPTAITGQNTPVNGRSQQLIGHLDFGEISPILSLSPDTYAVAIRDASNNQLFAEIPATALTTGKRYDVLFLPVSAGKSNDFRALLIVSDVADSGNP